MNLQTMGGRRFLLAVGVCLLTAILQASGKLDAAGLAFVAVVVPVVTGFITGNVIESKASMVSKQ
jgi:flagellar biosynthesis protein FliQ